MRRNTKQYINLGSTISRRNTRPTMVLTSTFGLLYPLSAVSYLIRYFIKTSLMNGYLAVSKAEHDVIVQQPNRRNMHFPMFSIQVGVIEQNDDPVVDLALEFKKTQYYLDECILGRIVVNKIKVPVKEMIMLLVKEETFKRSNELYS